jgi:hypothetical protein
MPGKRYTAEQIAKLREAEKSCAAAVPSDRTPTNGKHPREESYRHHDGAATGVGLPSLPRTPGNPAGPRRRTTSCAPADPAGNAPARPCPGQTTFSAPTGSRADPDRDARGREDDDCS